MKSCLGERDGVNRVLFCVSYCSFRGNLISLANESSDTHCWLWGGA